MKAWIVSSALFVPGRLMAPIRLSREIEALKAREAKLQAELAAIPRRLAGLSKQADALGQQYEPFRKSEIS